jgi:putative two-component system response regulator
VGRTTALLAAELGLPVEELRLMRLAAPLDDIGKIGIPDEILLRPGKLSPAEFALVTRHTVIGSEILTRSSSEHLHMAEVIARSHHERWDGSGYPDGLAAEAIPLPGRLVALADVFDALTHDRPYKSAWTLEQAVTEIRQIAGTQLDPAVVEAFDALDHAALLEPVEPALLEAQGTASQAQPRT